MMQGSIVTTRTEPEAWIPQLWLLAQRDYLACAVGSSD